jgi:beta-glucanase (GH16 family)
MTMGGFARARLALLALTLRLGTVPVTTAAAEAALVAPATTACGPQLLKADGTAWTCTFVDNFDGVKLDPARWAAQETAQTGFRVGDTCFKAGTGIAVSGGQVRLAVNRRASFSCASPYGAAPATFTGGAASTYGKFSQTYGRFEARVRFPAYRGPGLHGGFWMNPQDRTYGLWPASGEIDIAEWFSGISQYVFPSLHYTGRSRDDTGWTCPITRTDLFHTYAVEWSENRMDFFYDGQHCFSRTWMPLDLIAPKPFDRPFVVSLIASSGQGTNAPNRYTPSNSVTAIDYVKVWQ